MASEGWRCPSCGSVYAPWVFKCTTCPAVYGSGGGTFIPTSPPTPLTPLNPSWTGDPLPGQESENTCGRGEDE